MTPDLSISLVSFNRADLVCQCLESVVAHTRNIVYDVHLVAYNFGEEELDKVRRRWPDLHVHRVSGLKGYSANSNVALRAATGRCAAILNDDTILGEDVLGDLVRFLDATPGAAGACPVLRNPDGSIQMAVRGRFTPGAFIASQLHIDRVPLWRSIVGRGFDRPGEPVYGTEPIDVEAGTGACFVVRRSALEAIGFLDEEYFLGPDDIDWSMRLRAAAGRVVLLPGLSLVHLGGATLGRRYAAVLPSVLAGCYRLFRRHYGMVAEWSVRVVVGLVWSSATAIWWWAAWLVGRSARSRVMMQARLNCVRFALSRRGSPAVFAALASGGQ